VHAATDQAIDPPTPSLTDILEEDQHMVDIVVCSFALHLIETSSELFALLWELSTKCRWLVVLAPHKKPTACVNLAIPWAAV
jgi:cell division inhibitor SulA